MLTLALLVATLAGCADSADPRSATPAPTAAHTPAPSQTPTRTPVRRPGDSTGAKLMPLLFHGPRDKPRVALTFDADLTAAMRRRLDDGRVTSYYNAKLIAELRARQVPATLFLTGMWMERYPAQTKALAADPLFELGTHTYSHRAFTPKCYTLATVPRAGMLADARRAVRILDRLDPAATRWFRFPGGCYDGTALHELAPLGLTAVQLDVPGADGFAKSADGIVGQVLRNARNGSIVVLHMHGGDNAPLTDDALPAIVTGLRQRGFELVTVSRLVGG